MKTNRLNSIKNIREFSCTFGTWTHHHYLHFKQKEVWPQKDSAHALETFNITSNNRWHALKNNTVSVDPSYYNKIENKMVLRENQLVLLKWKRFSWSLQLSSNYRSACTKQCFYTIYGCRLPLPLSYSRDNHSMLPHALPMTLLVRASVYMLELCWIQTEI